VTVGVGYLILSQPKDDDPSRVTSFDKHVLSEVEELRMLDGETDQLSHLAAAREVSNAFFELIRRSSTG
jgi:hypothetical protein